MTTGPSDIVFLAIAALTVGSAVLVATLPNLIYSAVALLFSFAGVAGLFVFASADFLAATQVLVYVGGIIVLILFAVFLSHHVANVKLANPVRFRVPAALLCLVLFGVLSYTSLSTAFAVRPDASYAPTTAEIGELLMTRYLLPFEVASVLLLAALVGAALLSRPARKDQGKPDMEEA
ncbi:MAG TPA: NADH-quinone oxidoreductase subunit J [Candidatus Deferrimicrobiaceae bacterium]